MANYYQLYNTVQLGINDTALTFAIQKGDFKAAEKLILENGEPSFLDEGPLEKIPLTLVLANAQEYRSHRRNLKLAKLLVEGGANPNLRTARAEWQGGNASPMQHLVELFNLVVDPAVLQKTDMAGEVRSTGDIHPLYTIGLHNEENLTASQLKAQILELLNIFLAYGGDPNVRTTYYNSTLFHFAIINPNLDMDLLTKLCEVGGSMNQKNVHGVTPLMDIITCAPADEALGLIQSLWKINADISSLDDANCSYETALWRAMQAGSPQVAVTLLKKGANPAPRASAVTGVLHGLTRLEKMTFPREISQNGVSSIFAALLQDSSPNLRYSSVRVVTVGNSEHVFPFNVDLLDKVFSCTISPVVDTLPAEQCFPGAVVQEVMSLVSEETSFKLQSPSVPQDLALIFGKLSAGLQQMCVRVILKSVFFARDMSDSLAFIAELSGKNLVVQEEAQKSGAHTVPESWDMESENNEIDEEEIQDSENRKSEIMETGNNENLFVVQDPNNITHSSVVMALDETNIRRIVLEHLKLPGSLLPRFIAEAVRLQLGASVYNCRSTYCVQGCEESDDSSEWLDSELSEDDEDSSWSAEFISSDEYFNSDYEEDSSHSEDYSNMFSESVNVQEEKVPSDEYEHLDCDQTCSSSEDS